VTLKYSLYQEVTTIQTRLC